MLQGPGTYIFFWDSSVPGAASSLYAEEHSAPTVDLPGQFHGIRKDDWPEDLEPTVTEAWASVLVVAFRMVRARIYSPDGCIRSCDAILRAKTTGMMLGAL